MKEKRFTTQGILSRFTLIAALVAAPFGLAQNKTKITVLTVYTQAAKGVVADIDAYIQAAIDTANQSYADSQVSIDLVSAHSQQVALPSGYVEQDHCPKDILSDLIDSSDQAWRDIRDIRDTHQADLVALFTDRSRDDLVCQNLTMDNVPCNAVAGKMLTETEAYVMLWSSCDQGGANLAHELGHLQGGVHEGADNACIADGKGHKDENDNITMMANFCDGCVRIGWSHTEDADMARVLNETALAVSSYRSSGDAKLTASPESGDARFGGAVAVDGDWALVGAKHADGVDAQNTGAAYLLQKAAGAWVQTARLTADEGFEDNFGFAVAMSGTRAVVSANLADVAATDENGDAITLEDAGAVYVFDAANPDQWQKLTASDAGAGDKFGGAVAIKGDLIVVGARAANDGAGKAYVFSQGDDGWDQISVLTAGNDADAGDRFGVSVAIGGNFAAIGADRDGSAGEGSGSVFIFHRDELQAPHTWTRIGTLSPGDAGDRFGSAMALDGDVLVVGANHKDDSGPGAASIYRRTGIEWNLEAQLPNQAFPGIDGDEFGGAVAIHGDYVAVGALGHTVQGTRTGAAYLYYRYSRNPFDGQACDTAWGQVAMAVPQDGAEDDRFGKAVALGGRLDAHFAKEFAKHFLVGANRTDQNGFSNAGALYVIGVH